jgi:hypothetical protein
MSLKNRRIKCEISKTIQEQQYEPFQVSFSVEADISDKAGIDMELDELYDKLEERVYEIINSRIE